MENFRLGRIVQTRGIAETSSKNMFFLLAINQALEDYRHCNWGATCASDSKLNDEAVRKGNDRILARYKTNEGDIFICTEWDRSYTTIMYCDEY